MAPQSVASVFSLGDSGPQSHRHVYLFISVEDEFQRRNVSDYYSRRTRVVLETGTHAGDTRVGRICDVPDFPRGTGAQFYERL